MLFPYNVMAPRLLRLLRRLLLRLLVALIMAAGPVHAMTYYMEDGCPGPSHVYLPSELTKVAITVAPQSRYVKYMDCSVVFESPNTVYVTFQNFVTELNYDYLLIIIIRRRCNDQRHAVGEAVGHSSDSDIKFAPGNFKLNNLIMKLKHSH